MNAGEGLPVLGRQASHSTGRREVVAGPFAETRELVALMAVDRQD